MSTYNRISEIFDVKDLLQTNNPIRKHLKITNVTLDKGKGSGSIQVHITEKNRGEQRVLLFNKDSRGRDLGSYWYTNRTYHDDRGDVIQFIANRLKGKRLNDAIKLLNHFNYRGNAEKWKEKTDFEVANHKNKKSSSKPLKIEDFKNLQSIDKLILENKSHYLEKRNIANETLLHPKFVDRVMVYDNTVESSKGTFNFTNIFFPKYCPKETQILGAEIKTGAKTNNNLCLGIDHLMWASNKPETVEKVALFESAIDAISHYQMNPEENANTWYFSTNGNFYPARQAWFYEQLDKNQLNPKDYILILAMDRDYDGLLYDMAVFNNTLANHLPDKYQATQSFFSTQHIGDKISLQFNCHHPKVNKDVSEWFMKLQDYFNEKYIINNENKYITLEASDDTINLLFPSKSKLKDASKRLSASLARNIPIIKKSNVKIDKARYKGIPVKDWNEVLTLSTSKNKSKKEKTKINNNIYY